MKKIIYTLTPNPALDVGGFVDDLKPDEKAYVHDQTQQPGGNAINVARILTRLKIPVVATGFLGGRVGDEINKLLKAEKVLSEFIRIKGSSRTNITISDKAHSRQTRLSFPGPRIQKIEKEKLFRQIQKVPHLLLLVIGGSFPTGFEISDVKRLMKIARQKKVKTIVDCPGLLMKELILEKPFLIKPNLEEFQQLTGCKVKSLSTVLKKAQSLSKQVPFVCVSSVEGGTLLVTEDGAYFGKIPKIKIKSTVGAGDSMVGGMVAQLIHSEGSPEELLRWGLAAAAATLSNSGTKLGSAAEIRRLYRQIKIHRIFSKNP